MSTKDKLYAALNESIGKKVSIEWLAKQSGLKESTLGTYLPKLSPDVMKVSANHCSVADDFSLTVAELKQRLWQGTKRDGWEYLELDPFVSTLLERSRTNANLALELFNRPELPNRIDAFVLLIMTAWEQLLKAKIQHEQKDGKGIYVKQSDNSSETQTIKFSKALDICLPLKKDPVRQNLETVKHLRDSAAHLLVPDTLGVLSGYFQSTVMNYSDFFRKFTQTVPFRVVGTGLLTLATPYNSPSIEVLAIHNGKDQSREIKKLISSLEGKISTQNDAKFAVILDHELVITKRANQNTTVISIAPEGSPATILKTPKDIESIYPYRATEVASILKKRTGQNWSTNYVAVVADYLRVKKSTNEFHSVVNLGKSKTHVYSEAFVLKIINKLKEVPDLVSKAYAHQRRQRKQSRKI